MLKKQLKTHDFESLITMTNLVVELITLPLTLIHLKGSVIKLLSDIKLNSFSSS